MASSGTREKELFAKKEWRKDMFRKTSIIGLLAALIILVGIFYAVKYTGSEDRTFRSQVLEYDPNEITAIHVKDLQTGDDTEIQKEGDKWLLTGNGIQYNGGVDAIANIIGLLSKLNTESIVATQQDKWEKYQVDEQSAIRVRLYTGDDLAGDLFIGKFDFEQIPSAAPGRQPQTKMTSYVRPAEENKVYAVNGILRSNFQGGAKPFRDRNVLSVDNLHDINRVSLSGSNMQIELLKKDTASWTINGMPSDSVETIRYLRGLSNLRNYDFIDDVDISPLTPEYTARVEGNNFAPVTLYAYPAADSTIKYYITSTFNEGTVFNGMRSKTFEKIFTRAEELLSE
jgi:hypothetical protein